MGNFWDEIVKRFESREDIVNIPGAPLVTNKYMRNLQRRTLIPLLLRCKVKLALDVGTGIGCWARYLSDKAEFVIGIDISKEMIKIAKKKVKESNVDFVVATAYAIPFRSNSADLSLSCTCLQHIVEESQQQRSLREITRVTKDRMLILELMSKSKKLKLIHYPTLIVPKSQYMLTLRNLGVGDISDIGVDFLPFVMLIENFRNLLFNKLAVNVPSYGGSFKQWMLRSSYQILSVFALGFSIPFNKIIKHPSSDLTRHVLLDAKKT